MPWPIRLFQTRGDAEALYGFTPVGACWFDVWRLSDEYAVTRLSPEYFQLRAATRAPLSVMMPCGASFCVDELATSGAGGWQVSGTEPLITVAPSINMVGSYHGFIQNGIITDDVDGRTFPDAKGFP